MLTKPGKLTIAGAPYGVDALVLGELAEETRGRHFLHVARDDAALGRMVEALAFFAPGLEVLSLPAWDCLPYDRVSPNPEIVSRRIETLRRHDRERAPAETPAGRDLRRRPI